MDLTFCKRIQRRIVCYYNYGYTKLIRSEPTEGRCRRSLQSSLSSSRLNNDPITSG